MFDHLRHCHRLGLLSFCSALLAGCGSLDSGSNAVVKTFTPYRMDIVQGNVVTSEQVAVLRPGMGRMQVREILGTPLLASVFHAERWDYLFTLRRQGQAAVSRKVTVFFKNDVLDRFEADPLPSEAEFAATLDSGATATKAPKLEATAEQLQKFPAPIRPAEPQPTPPLPTNYPPLESSSR